MQGQIHKEKRVPSCHAGPVFKITSSERKDSPGCSISVSGSVTMAALLSSLTALLPEPGTVPIVNIHRIGLKVNPM